jgi:hypothetical protein
MDSLLGMKFLKFLLRNKKDGEEERQKLHGD